MLFRSVLSCAQVLAHHTALVDEEMAELRSEVRRVCRLSAAGGGEGESNAEGGSERILDGESLSLSLPVDDIFLPVLKALTNRLMATRQVPATALTRLADAPHSSYLYTYSDNARLKCDPSLLLTLSTPLHLRRTHNAMWHAPWTMKRRSPA